MINKFVHYFIYTFLVIYLVQRRNVKEINIQQSAIQAVILTIAFLISELLIKWYSKAIEFFDLELNSNMYTCNEVNQNKIQCKKSESITPPEQTGRPIKPPKGIQYNQFDDNDLNASFDKLTCGMPNFDSCKDMTNHLSDNSGYLIDNTSEHYNTLQPGYTYMNPKKFRMPETQPPVCLTDTPCSTQPVVLSTSLGREFLPYSKIKANIQLPEEKNGGSNKCNLDDTVYNS